MGVPVGVRASLSLALAQGAFDVVHGFEPGLPSLSYLALRDTDALAVATFCSVDRLSYPPGRAQRERLLTRLDALVALSERVRAAASERFPGDYRLLSPGVDPSLFEPAPKRAVIVVAPRQRAGRPARRRPRPAELPGWEAVLLRTKPLIARPAIPRDLAGRVRVRTARNGAARAPILNEAAIFVPGVSGLSRVSSRRRPRAARSPRPAASTSSPELAVAAAARLAENTELRERAGANARAETEGQSFDAVAAEPRGALLGPSRPEAHAPLARGAAIRSRAAGGSSPTCTCTPRGRSTARSTRPSSSTMRRPRGSERSPSPTTTCRRRARDRGARARPRPRRSRARR
jgi:hypothetical protein